jgi:hypothetical protein
MQAMPKIDPDLAPSNDGTGYPDPYAEPCLSRRRRKLGDAAGLTGFGVNLQIRPGGDAADDPDCDLIHRPGAGDLHRDGTPYPAAGRRYRP